MNGSQYLILCADVVRYSLLNDTQQRAVIDKLHGIVEDNYPGSALKDRTKGVFIATGDGMILAFGDEGIRKQPRQVVELAHTLHRELNPEYQLRIGLHRGEAETYMDFNARHIFKSRSSSSNNLAGAAINIAQRVMSLGDPGDILASQAFVEHYGNRHDQEEAANVFQSLGVIRVKHGTELSIHIHCPPDTPPKRPKRIRDYALAQNAIFLILKKIHDKVERAAPKEHRKWLQIRVGLLPYDSVKQELYVSTFLYWNAGSSEVPIPSRVTFALVEGPGRSLQAAMEGEGSVHYYELPPAPSSSIRRTPAWESYLSKFERLSSIPRGKIRQFRRHGCFYLYYPVHYADQNTEPFGVVSIDALYPIFPKNQANQLIDRLSKGLRPLFRQLGDAWTILSLYH